MGANRRDLACGKISQILVEFNYFLIFSFLTLLWTRFDLKLSELGIC
jgi:hypothetical protein